MRVFTNTMILELAGLLRPITAQKMPLAKKSDPKNKIDHWAKPKYWAEVEFRDITTDGLLRHGGTRVPLLPATILPTSLGRQRRKARSCAICPCRRA